MKAPKKNPNLVQTLFKGVSKYGFIIARSKNNKLTINDQNLISPLFNNGHRDTSKKKIKKITPKFLLEETLILLEFININ